LLRALHWWNALTLFLQIVSGSIILLLGDELGAPLRGGLVNLHGFTGYLFGAGLLTRILWLFIGPGTAGWRDIMPVTGAQRRVLFATLRFYARGLSGEGPLYRAHNPFAGLVYAAFFLFAALQVVTGAITFNMPESLRDGSAAFDLHGLGYYFFILYVPAHIFAVFVHELVESHSLISAMVNGRKGFTEDEWRELDEGSG
jgi:Ni/Fe-hydrogenase 1 B-type cytochrome subunit